MAAAWPAGDAPDLQRVGAGAVEQKGSPRPTPHGPSGLLLSRRIDPASRLSNTTLPRSRPCPDVLPPPRPSSRRRESVLSLCPRAQLPSSTHCNMVPTPPLHRNYPGKCHHRKTRGRHVRTHGGVLPVLVRRPRTSSRNSVLPSSRLLGLRSAASPGPSGFSSPPAPRGGPHTLLYPVALPRAAGTGRVCPTQRFFLDLRRICSRRPDVSPELSPLRLACLPPKFPSRRTAASPCPPRQRLGSPRVSDPVCPAVLHHSCPERRPLPVSATLVPPRTTGEASWQVACLQHRPFQPTSPTANRPVAANPYLLVLRGFASLRV